MRSIQSRSESNPEGNPIPLRRAPIKKASAPIALPLIAVFHGLWLVLRLWQFRTEPLSDPIWLQVVWLLLYGGAWALLTVCRNKWAANAYILLTALNLVLRFTLKDEIQRNAFTDALFPIDLLCSFVLLVFWRQLFPRQVASSK